MNQSTNKAVYPITAVVVMLTIITTLFMANVSSAFAATAKKKPAVVERTSAVEVTEMRINQLQSSLKITTDQELLWNDMIQVMRENAKVMDAISKERKDTIKSMNSVERLKFHSQITETHLTQQKKLIPVFEALYLSMSDGQKKIIDEIFTTGKRGKAKSTK